MTQQKHWPTPVATHGELPDGGLVRWFDIAGIGEFGRMEDAQRAYACVNACVGMSDPAAEIAYLRKAEAQLAAARQAQAQEPALAAALGALQGLLTAYRLVASPERAAASLSARRAAQVLEAYHHEV